MWIHEQDNWTSFQYDPSRLSGLIIAVHRNQANLTGDMRALGIHEQTQTLSDMLVSDVLKTSLIEGERLDPASVKSSIARRLELDTTGLPRPARSVEGIAEITIDANLNYQEPLTEQRLFHWHAALFPTGTSNGLEITTGNWRTDQGGPMRIVSGPLGNERVHYQAPPAAEVPAAMAEFLNWFEAPDGTDQLVKAGLAHFWFEAIHPFDDGNGRIGRAIADLALSRAHETARRFYSLSSQIAADRQRYYRLLETNMSGEASGDLTAWLEWFLESINEAIAKSARSLEGVLLRTQRWQQINQHSINDRQRKVISRVMEDDFQGFINTRKYQKLAKCSESTALRDINDLLAKGILNRNPGQGKNTSYWLA